MMRRNRNITAPLPPHNSGFGRHHTLRRFVLVLCVFTTCFVLYSSFILFKNFQAYRLEIMEIIKNLELQEASQPPAPSPSPQRRLLKLQKPISDDDVLHSQENRLAIQGYVEGMLFNHLNWNQTQDADSFLFTCHFTSGNQGLRLLTKNSSGIVCSSTCESVITNGSEGAQSNARFRRMNQLFDHTDDSDNTWSRSGGIVNGTHLQSNLLNSIWLCAITEDARISHGVQYRCRIPKRKDKLAS